MLNSSLFSFPPFYLNFCQKRSDLVRWWIKLLIFGLMPLFQDRERVKITGEGVSFLTQLTIWVGLKGIITIDFFYKLNFRWTRGLRRIQQSSERVQRELDIRADLRRWDEEFPFMHHELVGKSIWKKVIERNVLKKF